MLNFKVHYLINFKERPLKSLMKFYNNSKKKFLSIKMNPNIHKLKVCLNNSQRHFQKQAIRNCKYPLIFKRVIMYLKKLIKRNFNSQNNQIKKQFKNLQVLIYMKF